MKDKEQQKYCGFYAELASIVGEEKVAEIHKLYRGLEVSLPMRLYTLEYVIEKASTCSDKEIPEIAREYGYNVKHLKRMMSLRKREEKGK